MNGKELLLKALAGEETSRPAWVPFVGCHGGFLIGKTATDYLQSAELIVEGLKKAKEMGMNLHNIIPLCLLDDGLAKRPVELKRYQEICLVFL